MQEKCKTNCTFTLGIVFCLDHEAEIASAGILDRSIPRPRQDSMKVLLGESIIDFLLQTIVTTSIVGTANPDLQQVCKATFTNCKLSHTLYANFIFSVDDKKPTVLKEG